MGEDRNHKNCHFNEFMAVAGVFIAFIAIKNIAIQTNTQQIKDLNFEIYRSAAASADRLTTFCVCADLAVSTRLAPSNRTFQ